MRTAATVLDPATRLDPICSELWRAGEWTAAGYLELPDALPIARMSRAIRRQFEACAMPAYTQGTLYPSGRFSWFLQGSAVSFHYSHSLIVNRHEAAEITAAVSGAEDRALRSAGDELLDLYQVGEGIDSDIALGGANYTHSIINYGRVLSQGLDAHDRRVQVGLHAARASGDSAGIAFYRATADLLQGMRTLHRRCLAEIAARMADDGASLSVCALHDALTRVPWEPARTFYEGLVAVNWLYYLDGTDNLGRFDQVLGPLYDMDLKRGAIERADAARLVRELWRNVDANGGWNVALGGSTSAGEPAENAFTLVCLEAAQGMRRPNLALRVRGDMSDACWETALDCLSSGGGLPALYNEELYLRSLWGAGLGLTAEDLTEYAFGGCTEVMVHGCSNVGSLDAGLNLPLILAGTLHRALAGAESLDVLWDAFAEDVSTNVKRLVEQVNRAQALHATHQPQPIRTLLIDDCLDHAQEYNAGGARYNWSVINVGGLGNVADAFAALEEVVYDRHEASGAEVLCALADDWCGHELLLARLSACPRYGNDSARVDALACRIAHLVFGELGRYRPWRGGRFLPGCLMFTTYARAGEPVPATPDGRCAGDPIADSVGAVQGRDRHGPTALLRSVAGLPQHLAPGTLVLNLRVAPASLRGQGRQRLRELVETYFRLGGLQIQVTVVDSATLRDAVLHPSRHGDLIVRVGGYSEYWRNLSDALRRSIAERTEYLL